MKMFKSIGSFFTGISLINDFFDFRSVGNPHLSACDATCDLQDNQILKMQCLISCYNDCEPTTTVLITTTVATTTTTLAETCYDICDNNCVEDDYFSRADCVMNCYGGCLTTTVTTTTTQAPAEICIDDCDDTCDDEDYICIIDCYDICLTPTTVATTTTAPLPTTTTSPLDGCYETCDTTCDDIDFTITEKHQCVMSCYSDCEVLLPTTTVTSKLTTTEYTTTTNVITTADAEIVCNADCDDNCEIHLEHSTRFECLLDCYTACIPTTASPTTPDLIAICHSQGCIFRGIIIIFIIILIKIM